MTLKNFKNLLTLTCKPWIHVRILIYRTWPISRLSGNLLVHFGVGGCLFEARRLLTFHHYRVGASSRRDPINTGFFSF